MSHADLFTCPCCGYRTISGEYEICEICGWEYDVTQHQNPNSTGANRVSLREAQQNYQQFGAAKKEIVGSMLVRAPTSDDVRDQHWRALDATKG